MEKIMRWILIFLIVLSIGCAATKTQTHINIHTPARGDLPEVTVGVTFDNWYH